MIHVERVDEPATFRTAVRIPGLRAIDEMIGLKPKRTAGRRFKKRATTRETIPAEAFPSYWTEALDDLMKAYNQICAFTCFRIHEVTGWRSVDHFAPKSRNWNEVYEWTNYRLACGPLNARKKYFTNILDPFEIVDGWFQLELVAFQVLPNPTLDDVLAQKVRNTIETLGLNDFRASRERDVERYWNKDVSLRALVEESPFVAKELHRQSRLNSGDAWPLGVFSSEH